MIKLNRGILINVFQFSIAIGQRSDRGMHGGEILLGQVQNETAVSSPSVLASWPGAQAHLLAPGSVQHCGRSALHQETDGYADLDHD